MVTRKLFSLIVKRNDHSNGERIDNDDGRCGGSVLSGGNCGGIGCSCGGGGGVCCSGGISCSSVYSGGGVVVKHW